MQLDEQFSRSPADDDVDLMQSVESRDADIVWEIEIERSDGTSFDIIVDAVSGAVLGIEDGRGPDVSASDLDGYEEFATIKREVPDIADLSPIVETDNPNSRVIIFTDGNRPLYKSVYVKQQNRLKLIDLSGGGVLFDDTL